MKDIHCINPWKHQAQKVYTTDGLSVTLSANGGGQGGKTGLYIMKNDKIKIVGNLSPTGHHSQNIPPTDGVSSTLTATNFKHPIRILERESDDMLKLRESTKKGYSEADVGDGVKTGRSACKSRRGVVQKGHTGALDCQSGSWGTVTRDYRIRKLTPRECERLQAFPDDWTKYGENDELISDTQRYKCLGNAVTTTVITHLINEMFEEE